VGVRGAAAAAVVALLGLVPATASSAPPGVATELREARAPAAELRQTDAVALPGGVVVYRFRQEVSGVPVIGGEAVVNDARGAPPALALDKTWPGVETPPSARIARRAAIAIGSRSSGVRLLRGRISASLMIAPANREALVWRVAIPSDRPLADLEVLVDAGSGEVVRTRDLLRDFRKGHAQLYDPNPVVEHGGFRRLRSDYGDRDTRLLTRLRVPAVLRHIENGQRCLRGRWVHAERGPNRKETCKRGLRWNGVTRSDNRFEALMAYYHIDRAQRYIQSLGFSDATQNGINDRSQVAIADALTFPRDNSFYSPTTRKIEYGFGGVDDAEDADVILHEYGHAMQDSEAPTFMFGTGLQPGSLAEGSADYWAAAMSSRSLGGGTSNQDDVCIFDWDATSYFSFPPAGEFGDRYCGRRADYPKTVTQAKQDPACQFPDGPQGLDIHCIGMVWSSALWDLRTTIGDDPGGESVIDRDLLASQFTYTASESFADAANALITADRDLYPDGGTGQGQHEAAISAEMHARKLLP